MSGESSSVDNEKNSGSCAMIRAMYLSEIITGTLSLEGEIFGAVSLSAIGPGGIRCKQTLHS